MKQPPAIDLCALAKNYSAEIGSMIAGIENPADCGLWTIQTRATVLGGKPLGDPRIEDASDSDRNE